MEVIATCVDCGTATVLGARPTAGVTTACPDCGSTAYESAATDADDRDRIMDLASSTPGIGDETATALAQRMVTIDRLRDATLSELQSVPGVGSKNGRALLEQVN